MMEVRIPILLSFYAIAAETSTLIFGQLTYTKIKDFSFKDYSRRRTFRTLLSLYRTKPFADQEVILKFDKSIVNARTDAYGFFKLKINGDFINTTLQKATLISGEDVKVIDGLYPLNVQQVKNNTIVISDIDDTLIHSFIYRKIKKFGTLMFTTMEKRRTVADMHGLLQQLTAKGFDSFYLSNSEQNLYPLIFRFLIHNGFPQGPLFLKKMRGLWHVLLNVKFPLRNLHKIETLEEIISLFPSKKLILLGDNTQHDLAIYLETAQKFPQNVSGIFILKVVERSADQEVIKKHIDKINYNNIQFRYSAQMLSTSNEILNLPSS
jgi:phosphatidate phosphatase APP1